MDCDNSISDDVSKCGSNSEWDVMDSERDALMLKEGGGYAMINENDKHDEDGIACKRDVGDDDDRKDACQRLFGLGSKFGELF